MAKNNLPASAYAKPHTMSGKSVNPQKSISENKYGNKDFPAAGDVTPKTPVPGVSMGAMSEPKTTGIKMRGTGAATKGTMSRGPMA